MWILFYIIISLLIIYIGNQLWIYISSSFIKKKNIVSSQIEKYKSIIRELQENKTEELIETNDLKKDLEDFLSKGTDEQSG